MRTNWSLGRPAFIIAVACLALPAFAQKSGTSSPGASSGNSTSRGSTGLGNTTTSGLGTNPNNSTQTLPGGAPTNSSIFLNGSVIFDDGSKPSSDIVIERVCNGSPRPEAHTDSKGRFSFQLGQNAMMFTDASVSSGSDSVSNPNLRSNSPSSSNNRLDGGMSSAQSLLGCEIQAAYPGYRSDSINLSTRRSLDDPNIGTLVLHRLANVKGTTISLTSALAPKKAQKEVEKGVQAAERDHLEEAEKHFHQAVEEYPQFAVAWFHLGNVQQMQGRIDDARKSYQLAIAADSRYVSPYDRLALLAVREGKWQDAADISKQATSLNPVEFPTSFLYSAIANYNLKHLDQAEKNAKEVLKLDPAHHLPQAEDLLAQVLLQKGDYADAASHLRSYLALAPNSKNAEALKQELLKIEQASAARNTPQ